jgi:hypothetical protein
MEFIVNNQEYFHTNSAVHCGNTTNKHHLHRQSANLSCFQKNAYYDGIKFVYHLVSKDLWKYKI